MAPVASSAMAAAAVTWMVWCAIDILGQNPSSSQSSQTQEHVEGVSAFFIDTAARMDKSPYFESNSVTGGLKALLLLATLGLVWKILHNHGETKRSWRAVAVITCSVIFVARILIQMSIFWHRRITWNEVVAEAGFIIPLSLASLAVGAVRRNSEVPSFRTMDFLGVTVFLWGTYLNVASELQRHRFKLDPANSGRLFTLHLWQHSRHINYFGEIVSFVGFAMFCQLWNLWIPLTMGLGMALFSVPELDFYLARRYPDDWEAYVSQVKSSMIPYIW